MVTKDEVIGVLKKCYDPENSLSNAYRAAPHCGQDVGISSVTYPHA